MKHLIDPRLFCATALFLILSVPSYAMGAAKPAVVTPPTPPPRSTLKKLIELGNLTANNIVDSTDASFDFQTAINEQFPSIVEQAGQYVIATPQPGECIPNLAQMTISGSVPALELQSKTGGSLGYANGILLNLSASANFQVSTALMTITLSASDLAQTGVMASTVYNQKDTTTDFGASLDLWLLQANFSYYSTSPLAKVAQSGFSGALSQLAAQTKKYPWEGAVLVSDSGFVEINAGINVGMEVGDEFAISNVEEYWSGSPCNSTLLGVRPSPTPTAIVKVYDVEPEISWAEVTTSTGSISTGAQVTISQLVQPTKTVKP